MPTTPPTYWPLRQSLSYALRHILLTEAIPAINADLAARMLATDAATIPVFGDDSVVIGDIPIPPKPTLCIVGTARRNTAIATGTMLSVLTTQIRLKTPFVADNDPEDFALLASVLEDNLEDLLTCLAHRVITPTNPATGVGLLPQHSSFYECTSLGSNVMQTPVKSGDNTTMYQGWMLMHRAQINLALSRGSVVGTP
jgi:hypothetical protein